MLAKFAAQKFSKFQLQKKGDSAHVLADWNYLKHNNFTNQMNCEILMHRNIAGFKVYQS